MPDLQNRLFSRVFNNTFVAVAILDRNFNFLQVNEAYAALDKKTTQYFTGKNHFALYPSAEAEKLFTDVLVSKKTLHFYARPFIYPSDPERKKTYWDWTLEPILDEEGNVEMLILTLLDVTQRVQAEKEKTSTLRKLNSCLASITDAFFTLDTEWRFTYLNPKARRQCDSRYHGELLGRCIWDVCHELSDNKVREEFSQAVKSRQCRVFECYLPGAKKWFEIRAYPAEDGLSVFYSNITDRKLAEEKIRKSREKFYLLFEADQALKSVVRLRDQAVLAINFTWRSIFGLKKENVLGRSFLAFFPAADKNTENLMHELLGKAKRVRNKAIRLYKQDGSLMYCLLSTEIVELDNEDSMIITIVDVSKQRLMELEMARLDRLNLIGQMAGGIGHEIRNPMTTVHGFLQLLAAKEKYKEDREYFDIMLSELDRANSIITEFLALSKKEISVRERHNLARIVKRLEPLMEATALRLGKRITYRYSTVPDICANEKEIRQVILNLVHNAMDASDEISISVRCEGQYVILEVRDKGPGLDPEVLENLGKPFYTTKENGTGLGLPISFSIVQRHEGFIHVNADKNGTVFAVHLPVPVPGTMHLCVQDHQLAPVYHI